MILAALNPSNEDLEMLDMTAIEKIRSKQKFLCFFRALNFGKKIIRREIL